MTEAAAVQPVLGGGPAMDPAPPWTAEPPSPGNIASAEVQTSNGLATDVPDGPAPPWTWKGVAWKTVRTIESGIDWLFGLASLLVGLAALASAPGLCLLAYGYLLEVSGRIGRTGKLSEGWIGVRPLARLGSLVLCAWLLLLPLRAIDAYWEAATLVGNVRAAQNLWLLYVVSAILLGVHVALASLRGGRFRHFLWPFPAPWNMLRAAWNTAGLLVTFRWRRLWRWSWASTSRTEWGTILRGLRKRPLRTVSDGYAGARDAVWDYFAALRLPYYFSLGLRGFLGTWLWLLIPVALFAAGTRAPAAGFLGGFLLGLVALYLLPLQTHFAAENRWRAMLERKRVRELFARAPWAWSLAMFTTLASALPLYLMYVEYPPEQLRWMPALVFVLFALPSRAVAGWAYACSLHRPRPAHFFFRWSGRLWTVLLASLYVLILFFVQYISQDGRLNLFDQHAFSIPMLNDLLRGFRQP